MGFRDEGEAARVRAEALAVELAEKEDQIEALRAQLERKDAELRDVKEDASPILEAAERAQVALDALKRKKSPPPKAAPEAPGGSARREEEERDRETRRLSSVSVWGDFDVVSVGLTLLVPTIIATLLLSTSRWTGYAVVVPACAALALLAMKYWGRDWARRRWSLEEGWAKSRPYELVGYPETLEKKPGSQGGMPFVGLVDDEHQILELELEFAGGGIPADLAKMMSGFDDTLGTSNPLHQSPFYGMQRRARGERVVAGTRPNVFYRKSPVTTTRSKHGSIRTVDHNRAVRDWIRRLDGEVLEPLHARHQLVRVAVHLR